LSDLADDLAAQSVELWSHLPEDEVDDDAELSFKTDCEGHLMVCTTEGAVYKLIDGHAFRARPISTGEEVSMWRHRRLVHSAVVPAGEPNLN
jgi:hypothetical protein